MKKDPRKLEQKNVDYVRLAENRVRYVGFVNAITNILDQ